MVPFSFAETSLFSQAIDGSVGVDDGSVEAGDRKPDAVSRTAASEFVPDREPTVANIFGGRNAGPGREADVWIDHGSRRS